MATDKRLSANNESLWQHNEIRFAVTTKIIKKVSLSLVSEKIEFYRKCKKKTQKIVAKAKIIAYRKVSEAFETPKIERKIHIIARFKNKDIKVHTHREQIMNENE